MKELIYDINKSISIPESVEEMTGKQLVGVVDVFTSGKNKFSASLKALKVLGSKKWWQYAFISAEAKLRCLEHIQYIFEDLKLTKQLIAEYRGYHGPKSDLANFTLAEFFFSEIYYADFIQASQIPGADSLNKLIAVLYRPAKKKYDTQLDKDGDIRIEFNANTINYYSKKIARWPAAVKHAIFMFYDGCREKIKNNNPNIFSGDGSGEGTNTGMYGLMRGLAGNKFGEMEKVEKMYLHTALLEINLLMEEEERLEKAAKK